MKGSTILVVEDDQALAEALQDTLITAGYNVIIAEHGRIALTQLETNNVNLIVSDINMPQMNGIKLIGKLRELDNYKFTPLVMVTTETDDYRKKKARGVGATGWLSKPFTDDRIMAAVNKLLS